MSSAAIHDVRVRPLRRIPDERGAVLHMLREDDEAFTLAVGISAKHDNLAADLYAPG